jgi:FtsH-binding integral membrane protein
MCAIICCYGRTVPANYILLFVFTAAESYCVAGLTSFYDPNTVFMAGLTTALVTIALTIYAMFTKTDISVFYGLIWVVYLAMMPICIVGFVLPGFNRLYILYCCLGVIFYSLFLIIDTMQICKTSKSMGGYAVGYDDYVIGALQLYLDIIMIFVYLLQIFGQR